MAVFRRIAAGMSALLRGRQIEQDLDDELGEFLTEAVDAKVRSGVPHDEAVRLARLELGSAAAVKDRIRDVGWESIVGTTWRDVRYGARLLRRSPGFSLVAIAMLALAIGANTAIFSLVDALMLRDLPVREPGRLVQFLTNYPGDPPMNFFSSESYERFRDRGTVFSDVMGVFPLGVRAAAHDPDKPWCDYVTGNFFEGLGLRSTMGRLLTADDDGPSSVPSVVVSWTYWTGRFGSSPAILGRHIEVNGVQATVVGVAPREFSGLIVGYVPDVWMPAAFRPANQPDAFMMLARLKDGVSLDQAVAESRVLDRARLETKAQRDPVWRRATLDVVSARAGFQTPLHQQFGKLLWVLMALVAALLLIACTNVASMLLARAAARQREIAVRVSLGASRLRILRQVLTESVLLAGLGAGIGILGARAGAALLLGIMTSGTRSPSSGSPPRIDLVLDWRVLLFTTLAAVAAAIVFGIAPAWSALSSAPAVDLRASAAVGPARSRKLFGNGLVVAQVAASVVLLTVSDLYIGHLARLRDSSLGFDRSSVLLVSVNAGTVDRERARQRFADLLTQLGAIPGVHSVTVSGMTPISGAAGSRFAAVEGFVEPPQARRRLPMNTIAPNYFATFGTPLLAGRDIRTADSDGPRVAIVNQAMARHYFGGASPLGKHVLFDGDTQPYEIVGLVGDAKYSDVRIPAPATIYTPYFRGTGTSGQFALRTSVPPTAIVSDARRVIDDVMPDAAGVRFTTLAEQVDASIVPERLIAALSGFFGGLAVAHPATGLYGLLAYTVTRRTNEIGVRMALGATQADVMRLMMKGALTLVLAGLVVGAPMAMWAKRLAASMLVSLSSGSAMPVAVAAVATIGAALIAAYVPARRASRVQPVDALRHQ
jgi:predicted permease